MSRARFNITTETVTPESAEHGEAELQGFEAEGLTLREAFDRLEYEGHAVAADVSSGAPSWLTFPPSMCYRTAAETTLSVHIPHHVTRASAVRIGRLFGWQA